jgi:adenosylcobyric acid synthase
MGRTTGEVGLFNVSRITDHGSHITSVLDGSINGNVWGTYIHGIFDNDQLRRGLLNCLRLIKGLDPIDGVVDYQRLRDDALNRWAGLIRQHVDICFILRLLGLEDYQKTYCMRIRDE